MFSKGKRKPAPTPSSTPTLEDCLLHRILQENETLGLYWVLLRPRTGMVAPWTPGQLVHQRGRDLDFAAEAAPRGTCPQCSRHGPRSRIGPLLTRVRGAALWAHPTGQAHARDFSWPKANRTQDRNSQPGSPRHLSLGSRSLPPQGHKDCHCSGGLWRARTVGGSTITSTGPWAGAYLPAPWVSNHSVETLEIQPSRVA